MPTDPACSLRTAALSAARDHRRFKTPAAATPRETATNVGESRATNNRWVVLCGGGLAGAARKSHLVHHSDVPVQGLFFFEN
jgi:hypothetical protein